MRYKPPFDAAGQSEMQILENFLSNLSALWGFAQSNPKLFGLTLLIGLGIAWFKWKLIGKSAEAAQRNAYLGWHTKAKSELTPRETGIGHQKVLVMRPVKVRKIAILTILFFGSGAAFMSWQILEGRTVDREHWFATIVLWFFGLMGIYLLLSSFTKITFTSEAIECRGPLVKTVKTDMSKLTSVEPLSKTISGGVRLKFADGDFIKVPANMFGYRELLDQLAQKDPKLKLLLRLHSQMADRRIHKTS